MRFYDDIADDFHGERADVTRKRHTETTPRIYPGDVIDVDGRIIRIPKETPMTRHPETTTEWLEDIALELHAITGLLNERLPVVHPGGQPNELNNSTPDDEDDEVLAQVLWDHVANSEFDMHYIARRTSRTLARAAREHIEAERPPETDWEGLFGVEQRKREKAEADRDEWKARAERFAAAMRAEIKGHDETQARVDELLHERQGLLIRASQADAAEKERGEWRARYAALREDVEGHIGPSGLHVDHPDIGCIDSILTRDDERGERDA